MNIASHLRAVARRMPEKTALIDVANDRHYSFSEFAGTVLFYGRSLKMKAELKSGDRVAILADACVDYLYADYGVMAAGLVRVALDPSLSADEIAAQISDAGASVLLYGVRQAPMVLLLADQLLDVPTFAIEHFTPTHLDVMSDAVQSIVGVEIEANSLAALNYTGGTTGVPKAVMHTHHSLLSAVANIGDARGPWSGDIMLNVRPLWPIAAISVLSHLLHNGTVVLGGHFSPDSFANLVDRYEATCTSLVPTHLVRLVRDIAPPDKRFGTLKCIDIGAAALAFDVLDQAKQLFGPSIAMLYGLTEAPWSCYRTPADTALIAKDAPETHGLVGRPTAGARIRIVSADGADLPCGEVGEVLIGGEHLSQGYWHLPDLSLEAFRGNWFFSGDLGRVNAEGMLFLHGRKKNVIRSGGKSLQPQEVEEIVAEHPSVIDVSVVGMPDVEWGEKVVAAIVIQPGQVVSAVDLTAHCHARLSAHKRPKSFYVFSELPRSHYGKVQLAKVKAMIEAGTPLA